MKKRSKIKNSFGFTMVELLCTIVILGVLSVFAFSSVSRLVEKARSSQLEQQEKIVQMATESYLQANTNLMPKAIGESVRIPLKDVKKAKYLKDDIVNSSGEDCMKESYVRVYKFSKLGYTYTTQFYCGDEMASDEDVVPKPTIKVYFTDHEGAVDSDYDANKIFEDVENARLKVELTGGATDSGTKLGISSYSYSISVATIEKVDTSTNTNNAILHEIYNSGSLAVNNKSEYIFYKTLTEYIDVTEVGYVQVRVNVINNAGGIVELIATSQNSKLLSTFNDTISSTCSGIND